jgi:hypothetical protein
VTHALLGGLLTYAISETYSNDAGSSELLMIQEQAHLGSFR